MYNHILLNKIFENNNVNFTSDDILNNIKNLGLVCKANNDNNRIIVKYPMDLRFSNDDVIRKSRGIIIDIPSKSVICHSLDGAVSLETFKNSVSWEDTVIEKAYDGTMLNIYYDNIIQSWKVSTKYSLTPEKSSFRSKKSFVELFNEILPFDKLAPLLDKDYCYTFLMCHKDNRNVTVHNINTVYHLETVNIKTGEKIMNDLGIPRCEILQLCNRNNMDICKFPKPCQNMNDLIDYANLLDWLDRGYMLFSKDRKLRCKVENPKFLEVQKLLDGQSDLRYVAMNYIMRNKITPEQWTKYITYYPNLNNELQELTKEFNNFNKDVYKWYVDIYCFKKELTIPKWVKSPLYFTHQLFIEKKKEGVKNYRINQNDITERLINKLDVALVYQLMKDRKNELKDVDNMMC
jgi:hypothetical protein